MRFSDERLQRWMDFGKTENEVVQMICFDAKAEKILAVAKKEARRLRSSFISTEHLLMGALKDSFGIKVFKKLGVDMAKLKTELEKTNLPNDPTFEPPRDIGPSPRCANIFELARETAVLLGSDIISTEHLLLGIARETEGIAAVILETLDIKLGHLRDTVLELIGEPADNPGPGPAPDGLTSAEKAEAVVSAWLAYGDQETIPNHTEHLKKLIAWALEAARRGA